MGRERRYLVISELFLPTKGGTAVWFDEVYRRLGGKGTHILTAAVLGAEEYDRTHPNTIHRLALRHSTWIRPASLAVYTRFFLMGLGLVLRHDFEAVHGGRVLPEGFVGWFLARLARRPLVIYAHGEEITAWRRRPRRLKAMSFAYRRADTVIANSDFTRQELLKLGVAPERIQIIHPGVDLARFHPNHATQDLRENLGLTSDQKLILSVGRLNRRKGFDQVIHSLPGLLAQGLDVHYAIIGTSIGKGREYLEGIVRERSLEARVHFLGHVEAEDLPRWYRAADVFAMPNREINGDTEGFGMVFVEAAACGIPSVAGQAGGTGAAVLDGATGFRVDGTDLEQIIWALSRLLRDPELARTLGENGRARAVRELAWERVAERIGMLEARLIPKTTE